jgi:hypothetical protein
MERRLDWSWLLGDRKEGQERLAREAPYTEARSRADDAGFEGLIAQVKEKFTGRRPWRFQVQYYPETERVPQLDPAAPEARCDWNVEWRDSEVCQGYWVWASLNKKIRDEARNNNGWTIIEGHRDAIRAHGWCNGNTSFQLRLPIHQGEWRDGWRPERFDPYHREMPRWFRTTNDSILTQYESAEHHHKGTMHPTYRAHLEIAAAVLTEAFADGPGASAADHTSRVSKEPAGEIGPLSDLPQRHRTAGDGRNELQASRGSKRGRDASR